MMKNFNSVQMLETSEVCKKFSKSVSYETLVGGTATTGMGIKQTRRLSKGSANKPLTAVGTLTSLQRNSAKVVEKWLQISPVLRLVKVLGLVAVLSVGIISESLADCNRPANGVCKTLGESGTCGTGCSYTYDQATQTVNITATGDNAEIEYTMFHRLYYEGNSMPARKFIINGAVRIGDTAIIASHPFTVSGADGALVLTGLGQGAIGENGIFSGTIIIPEGATFAESAFNGKFAANAKIYCNVENCEQKMIKACGGDLSSERCKTVSKIISEGQLFPFPDGCAVMGATGCTKCKNSNFKLNDGECDRLRWTPAEAAKVLRDDNTNEVTITFKK